MTTMLLIFITVFIAISRAFITPNGTDITGFRCGWTSKDFYYRAIAVSYLRVVYSSSDNTNILNTEHLTEIRNIEKQIKSWSGYADYSILNRDNRDEAELLFPELSNYNLYCESTPMSAINFIFPEFDNEYVWFTGGADSIYVDWKQMIQVYDFGDYGYEFYFDSDTFTMNNNYQSTFIAAAYPFGWGNANSTRDIVNSFMFTYDQLLTGISSDKIELSWSYNYYVNGSYGTRTRMGFPQMVSVNDKNYQHTATPSPTYAPTVNYTEQIRYDCYSFGYSTGTGDSDGQIQYQSDATHFPTQAPTVTMAPTRVLYVPTESCRKTFFPKYEVENANDMIYYDNYRWNIVDGNNEYYCNVLFRDILLCKGQWKDAQTGEFVDLSLADLIETSSPLMSSTEQFTESSSMPTTVDAVNGLHTYLFYYCSVWNCCILIWSSKFL